MRIISTHRAWSGLVSCVLLLGLLFSSVSHSFASAATESGSKAFDKIVKGRITDATGAGLSGASISKLFNFRS